jgi:hypothetical protein
MQHRLYSLPLPHGQGAFLEMMVLKTENPDFEGFCNSSMSSIFSGLSGSMPAMTCHPFLLHKAIISTARSSVCTLILAGFAFDPNFAIFFSVLSRSR